MVARLSSLQLQLLHWLANHPRRPASSIHPATMDDVRQRLPGLRGWVSDIAFNPSLRPAAVLRLAPIPPPEVLAGQALAWHGTSFENLHSVLHTGLLNLSGTRLERTGAAFGKGIYFSSEITVAYAFCPASAATAWGRGALGRRLRCLLVCGVDRDHALQGTGEVRALLVGVPGPAPLPRAGWRAGGLAGWRAGGLAGGPAAAEPVCWAGMHASTSLHAGAWCVSSPAARRCCRSQIGISLWSARMSSRCFMLLCMWTTERRA